MDHGELWEVLAERIVEQGGKILKSHKVISTNIKNNKIVSVECEVNGNKEEIIGDIFISSMPIKDLIIGMKKEEVPKEILNIANGLPYRDFITVGVLVKKLKIRNETKIKTLSNIVPDTWIYVQEPEVHLGRIQIFNNWSPYLVKNPEENVWLGLEYFANEDDKYWNMDDKEFINFSIDELEKIGIINKEDVLDTHREKVKKAYPAYFDTYSDIDKLIKYIDTYENLYCVGRNGQHRYNNMYHSMLTAIEAVNNIKNNIKDNSNIWNVNTEKTYHEKRS